LGDHGKSHVSTEHVVIIESCLTYAHAFANAVISIDDQRKQNDLLTGKLLPTLIEIHVALHAVIT